ncbi:MAG: methyltransferase domain-containing protein [Phycisphaerae bacterium]
MSKQTFTEEILNFLTSPRGTAALELAGGLDPAKPSDVAKLRKHCTLDQSRAVLELVELRHRARAKFSRADLMFFDRKGYEQASGEIIADYKAGRVKLFHAGEDILDLCCGIGGDTLALAAVGKVTGIDLSPERIHIADLNLQVYQRRQNVTLLCADLNTVKFTGGIFHFDPDRRKNDHIRTVKIEELSPGKEFIDRLLKEVPNGAIKLSPATEYSELPWEGEIELISYKGQCRQLLLWTGKFADVKLKATSLPSACAITDEMPVAFNIGEIGAYLYDPDPAVSRLRLLGQLAAELGLKFLAPGQIVLTSDRFIAHPLARAFRVEEIMPYHEDKVRRYFRESQIGPVTVKPRGVAVNVDKVSKLYSGKTGPEKVLFLLRLDKKILAVMGEEER